MKWKRSVHIKWTLGLLILVIPYVCSRPQDVTPDVISSSTSSTPLEKISSRDDAPEVNEKSEKEEVNLPRDGKSKSPIIGESIKMVTTQLLDSSLNKSSEATVVIDTRIPPKLKNQLAHKHKIKTRNDDGNEPLENFHAGVAVPVSDEELDTDNSMESSTSNEGISTWVLVSNPVTKDTSISPTEPTKIDESLKKKHNSEKNKTKRPQNTKVSSEKRPIIGSTSKTDLIAGGSAITENIYNKIKDTVLTNVQKNKNASVQRTTASNIVKTNSSDVLPKKKNVTKISTSTTAIPAIKVSTKVKNKNKIKSKTSTTPMPVENESSLLPLEAKEQEIELEVSTPATTTKKPKRSSTRKKNKTKKRKTTGSKLESESEVIGTKSSNKTKSSKPSKKPSIDTTAITSQIYNYFSREVMPSVGVGVIGLAGLVGLASYFLYPFSTPVRRTFEVDKKDDLYRHNAEEYASEGNGQAEEEMLGTVLAGMPSHAKQKLNPYAGQTAHLNRYPLRKEQDIRYRHVVSNYDQNYSNRYPQQKTGIAHGAVYPDSMDYNLKYDTRHMYTTESKYNYDKPVTYPAVEPIYAAPQTGPSASSSYGSDVANSGVYGIKPNDNSDFKPVYPYESQIYSETTNSPITYSQTSMYLGSDDDSELEKSDNQDKQDIDSKFVVGNVPKELTDSATPAVVPEHGPRQLNKRKKRTIRIRRATDSTDNLNKDIKSIMVNADNVFMNNEVDGLLSSTQRSIDSMTSTQSVVKENMKQDTADLVVMSNNNAIIESVSTFPLENINFEKITTDFSNDIELITRNPNGVAVEKDNLKVDLTTEVRNSITETTTDAKTETTSTMPYNQSPIIETKEPDTSTITIKPTSTYYPEVITYPPLNQDGGFFTFLKRLIEFKYRLGLSILQSTSESLNRYLRSMEDSAQKATNSSRQ